LDAFILETRKMKRVRFMRRSTYNDSLVEPGTEIMVPDDTPLSEHMVGVSSEEAAVARAEEAEAEARELRAAFEALPNKEKVEAAEKRAGELRKEADKATHDADEARKRGELRDKERADRAPQFSDHTADLVTPGGILQRKTSSSMPDAPTPVTQWTPDGAETDKNKPAQVMEPDKNHEQNQEAAAKAREQDEKRANEQKANEQKAQAERPKPNQG
jgi:hypothetical protein